LGFVEGEVIILTKKILTALVFCAFILVSLLFRNDLASASPGDASDPVVTRSYVDAEISRLLTIITSVSAAGSEGLYTDTSPLGQSEIEAVAAEVMAYVDAVYGGLLDPDAGGAPGQQSGAAPQAPFEVLVLPAGRTLVAQSGSEIILRGGSAVVVSGVNGLCDVTAGRDIINGGEVPLNHLLIVPSSDGRGITVTNEAYIMVKGEYNILY
jgi:hypothetical protein